MKLMIILRKQNRPTQFRGFIVIQVINWLLLKLNPICFMQPYFLQPLKIGNQMK